MNIRMIGIILMIVGMVFLSYTGFTYKEREKIAEVGDLQLTSETTKRINFPPLLGGLALVAGLVLVVVGRGRK